MMTLKILIYQFEYEIRWDKYKAYNGINFKTTFTDKVIADWDKQAIKDYYKKGEQALIIRNNRETIVA